MVASHLSIVGWRSINLASVISLTSGRVGCSGSSVLGVLGGSLVEPAMFCSTRALMAKLMIKTMTQIMITMVVVMRLIMRWRLRSMGLLSGAYFD